MLRLERILIPVDFSASSEAAARHAAGLAERFQSEVHILHVLDTDDPGNGDEEACAGSAEERHAAEQSLAAFLANELKLQTAKRVLACGDPAGEIVRYANETACSLIAMPTHGAGVLRRMLLGSVTAKVLHDAACPVWTGVHAENFPELKPAPLTKVLCAVEFSENNLEALRWAKELAETCQARLGLVHALPSVHETWRPEMEKQTRAKISKLLTAEGIQADVSVAFGEVGETIAASVGAMGADLVVIGRGAASGSLGRLRSSAYAIIRESPCPVISV